MSRGYNQRDGKISGTSADYLMSKNRGTPDGNLRLPFQPAMGGKGGAPITSNKNLMNLSYMASIASDSIKKIKRTKKVRKDRQFIKLYKEHQKSVEFIYKI